LDTLAEGAHSNAATIQPFEDATQRFRGSRSGRERPPAPEGVASSSSSSKSSTGVHKCKQEQGEHDSTQSSEIL
jgi:hypothetical protein